MRITAKEFGRIYGDVAPTELLTSDDVLREAFLAGATEAEVLQGHPNLGEGTLRVRGLSWLERRALRKRLNGSRAPIGVRIRVTELLPKGRDDA